MSKYLKRGLALFLAFVICCSCGVFAFANDYSGIDNSDIEKKAVSVTLPANLSVGAYTLWYENESVVIENYAPICTLEVTESDTTPSYSGFIEENCAPKNATGIGIYNSLNTKVGEIPLGELGYSNYGEKKYSFAAISDVHIGVKTSEADFSNALQYFEADSDIEFITIAGDLTHNGTPEQLATYKSIIDSNSSKPVYAISGNHESLGALSPLAMDALKPYTGHDLYYSFTKGNDVYIMLGLYGNSNFGQTFAPGELQWFYETLEANRNKRCFVFMHVFPDGGSGDALGLYSSDFLNNVQGRVFYSLLSHYSNVIYLHGHSHAKFRLQELNPMNNYDDIFGRHSIHVPSITSPTVPNSTNDRYSKDYNGSEGYIVDVYDNSIVLRGRDFVSGKFLPIASYCLDTNIKTVEENTFFDSTGTILNNNSSVLKSGSSWYNSSVDKNEITEISFVKNYNGFADETWDAGIADNGIVTVYRDGTELFIQGNEKGVWANENCNGMFAGFTNLKAINGFENLNKENITTIEGMFKNCNSLVSLDLSSFEAVKPVNLVNVFSGCNSLTEIDLSYFDLSAVKQYLNVFRDCTALKSVAFGDVYKDYVYMSGSFMGCASIEKVDLSGFKTGINLGQTFYGCASLKSVVFPDSFKVLALNLCFMGCASLEALDISGFDVSTTPQMSSVFKDCVSLKTLKLPSVWDTSNVTTMHDMFYNCPKLTLDCSDWDNTSLTDMTGFKVGSPAVVAPPHTEKIDVKEPTCTEQGYTIHTCSVCGYDYRDSYIDALGHTVEKWNVSVEPTCVVDGSKAGVCSVCGVTVSGTIDALGHNYSTEWSVDITPTCTENGSKSRHCLRCDEKTNITTILANGHTSSDWIVDKQSTCTEKGSKHKQCTICDEVTETETIPANGHTEVKDVSVAPTCTASGKTEGSHCSVCDAVTKMQTEIPANGHTSSDWIVDKQSTCTEKGSKHKQCTVCDEVTETETIPATGHTSSGWIVDKQATCTEKGSKHKYCIVCDEVTETEMIPANGHTEVKDVSVAPTCTASGKTEGSHCSVCGAVTKMQIVVPAKGHIDSAWLTDKIATVDAPGIKHKECVECGELLESAQIPQLTCAAPKLSKVQNSVKGVKITWVKVNGADKYRVYHKTKGGSWEKVGDTTSTTIIDKKVKSGVTYYYTVKAFNEVGGGRYDKTGLAVKHVPTPTLDKIENATTSVKITWSRIDGADGYVVYRKASGEKDWTRITIIKDSSKNWYKDTKVSSGKTYTYTIRAYDGNTYSSFYADGISINFLATPALKRITSTKTGVALEWGKVTGANGYIVYRKTGSGSWERMAVVKGSAMVSFVDKTAKKGVTYTYTVRAYYGDYRSYYNTKGITVKDKY